VSLGFPLFVFYVAAFILPQATFLEISFHGATAPGSFGAELSLANYVEAMTDSYYLAGLRNSLLVAAAVSVFGLLFALPVAYFIGQNRTRLGSLVLILVVGMLFSNAVTRVLGWRILLSSVGPVNVALMALGRQEPLALLDNYTGVTIGLVHTMLPIYIIGLVPVCQTVTPNLLHASAGLGATRWRTFWSVVFPLIRVGVFANMLLIFATTIGAFTTPALLGGGRVLLLPLLIREGVLLKLNWPLSAALAAILTVITLLLVTVIAVFASGRWRGHRRTAMSAGTA
jgi:ABC-type spermidine/putrescine transport system permease subunit I